MRVLLGWAGRSHRRRLIGTSTGITWFITQQARWNYDNVTRPSSSSA
jgi:hypothetical protein